MKYKFHQNKVSLTGNMTKKSAIKAMSYIRRYKSKPLWKNLSIAKRYNSFMVVGVKR